MELRNPTRTTFLMVEKSSGNLGVACWRYEDQLYFVAIEGVDDHYIPWKTLWAEDSEYLLFDESDQTDAIYESILIRRGADETD